MITTFKSVYLLRLIPGVICGVIPNTGAVLKSSTGPTIMNDDLVLALYPVNANFTRGTVIIGLTKCFIRFGDHFVLATSKIA